MKGIAAALLIWINANSGYEYLDEPPKVVKTDPEALAYLLLGEVWIIPERAKRGLMGLYDVETRTIWLRDDFDPKDYKDRSHLVHELVHFLQYEGQRAQGLVNQSDFETEAYEIQNRYLRAHDLPPIKRTTVPDLTR
jgi:hypothetical protein